MPDQDIFDQIHSQEQSKGDVFDQAHAAHSDWQDFRQKHPILSAIPDLVGGIGAGVISTGVGAYDLARKIPGVSSVLPEPSDDVRAATVPPDSLAGKSGKFIEQGAEMMLPAGAAVDAVKGGALAAKIGPTAARIGAEALANAGTATVQSGGDPTSALVAGGATGVLGGLGAAMPAAARATAQKLLSNAPLPLSQGAIDLAGKYGIDLSQGMRTGSKSALGVEKLLGSTVAPDISEKMAAKGQAGMNKAATDLAGGFTVDDFAAADRTADKLLGHAADFKNKGSDLYDQMAKVEADPAYTKSVQVGTQNVPASGLLDASGNPVTPAGTAPVMKDIALPVDLRPAKQAFAPVIKELERDGVMTQAQKMSDPGLSALKSIMSLPDAAPASEIERNLGYLKKIMGNDKISPMAKRVTGQAIDSLSGQIDDAVKGTPAEGVLQQARSAWKSKSDIEDLVQGLTKDKSATAGGSIDKGHDSLIKNLFVPSDGHFPLLQKVLTAAPDAKEDLAKSAIGNVFRQAEEKPGFYNPASAEKAFNRMGRRTKEALFEPEHLKNIESFFDMSKRFNENVNPSGTGPINAMMKMLALGSHPVQAGIALGFGRPLARVLYNPEGATALNAFLKAQTPQERTIAASVIKAIAAEEGGSAAKSDPSAISTTITKP